MMPRRIYLLLTCLLFIVSACSNEQFHSTELPPDMPTKTFTLTNQLGESFSLDQNKGKVVVAFFGFTYCPDVCPAALSKWAQVQNALKTKADQVKFVYITVDPERDTPETLQEHLKIYSPDFIGLTGETDALQDVYKNYGVFREKVTVSESAAGYLVNHTARFYIFDKTGRWRLTSRNETTVEEMTHDIKLLLKEADPKISISQAWSRPATANANGVVYMTINNSGKDDRLIKANSDVAEFLELHKSSMKDGKMKMHHLHDGLKIPAKSAVEFKPMGLHIMLINLRQELKAGDRFSFTLEFEKSGKIRVESQVSQMHPNKS